jgi:DNA topoisomerase-2
LAGAVAELSSYNHGEESLLKTIINLAQNFVGSNNFNLLFPIGQFGSRIDGGKNFGKPDCIFTALHPLTRLLFNPKDDPLLNYTNDNGQLVEPDFYCPIIPTVLVNGAEGNGTEWSTRIPNYNPRDIIQNLKCLINGEQTQLMLPYFKNFQGQINRIDDTNVITSGKVVVIDENTIEITELPISVWTQEYKDYCCVGLGSQCRERMRERERLYL